MSEATEAPEWPRPEVPMPPTPPARAVDPLLADRVFDRLTTTGPAALRPGVEIIRRKERTFTMDGQSCSPDTFVDPATGEYLDFQVTLRSLTTKEEIEALQGLSDPGQVPYLLCRAALYAINGRPIPQDRKDFFWEAFGMQGRQICLIAFQHIGSASGAALGKYQSSITVG